MLKTTIYYDKTILILKKEVLPEKYECDQSKQAAFSIMLNIAEEYGRYMPCQCQSGMVWKPDRLEPSSGWEWRT